MRDPFAPAEDKATPATVSTPTTRIVTAPRAAAPVVQQSTPVVRAPGTAEPGIQVFTQPARNSTVVPQPAPVTTAPTAIVTAPNPVVTLTPVTPQASAVTPAVPQTSSIPPVREITVTSPAVVVTTPVAPVVIPSSTPTAGPVAALQTPVPAPASAPALNVTQQWLQDHRVTYGGRADSGENTTVILNTNEGQVFVDVGQVIPGTEVTLTSADNQNLVFTQKSKTAKLTIPASPTTDTGAQP
ncbi:hypothetical protein [Deinococcus sp. Leaf326]|uniref:hypothetical protein n=1 Tax=Deinococcus sp. Leaf326 TaxID=1736338 RepID=UPI0012E1028E|nr:hypothetical protein [Deinococcus sp. Leaf326]